MNSFFISLLLLLFCALPYSQASSGHIDTTPTTPVKLAFVHHSTSVNWLADPATNELDGGMLNFPLGLVAFGWRRNQR